jgi:uncharacterized damage-inducible protein DinB
MSLASELLVDGLGRVRDRVHEVVSDLSEEQLAFRPFDAGNPIGWLVWHLTRVQDDHVATVAGTEQVWTAGGWVGRFALPFEETATGYGQSDADVAAVHPSAELLVGYHDAVHERTVAYVEGLDDAEYARVVDERWDPPVTLGVRLISVVNDDTQHVGQAAYVRGLIDRQ